MVQRAELDVLGVGEFEKRIEVTEAQLSLA
jgi:uncharacterized small protein (DUF1192 family)